MLMDRPEEPHRQAFRSLRSYGSRDGQLTLDSVRVGGDGTKLLNHYGYSAEDFESSPSAGQKLRNPLSLIRPSESNESLRKKITGQRGLSSYKSQDQLREVPSSDSVTRTRTRDAPKFSFRKVFGLNTTDQQMASKSRESTASYDTEPANNTAADVVAANDIKRRPPPASKRPVSVEHRSRPASAAFPDESRLRNEKSNSDLAAEPPTVPTRRRRSTVKRVQSDEKTTRPRSTALAELSQTFAPRAATPTTPSPSKSHEPKHPIPLRRSSSRHRENLSRDLSGSDIPPLPIRSAETIEKLKSAPSSNASDEKKTIRPNRAKPHLSTSTKPRPQPTYVLPSEYSPPASVNTWSSSTVPRQAMEAASFFARISELEDRMASAERSLAKLKRKDKQRQQQQQQKPDQVHGQREARRSMHSVYDRTDGYMESTDTKKPPPTPHPYLTPPSSQLSEVSGREPTETWLDPSSSTSSFANSLSASSRRPSSTTSITQNIQDQFHSSSPSGQTLRPLSGSSNQNFAVTGDMIRPMSEELNDPRNYVLSKISAERASRRVAVLAGLETLRNDLARLRTDASSSPGPFGKAASSGSRSFTPNEETPSTQPRGLSNSTTQQWRRKDDEPSVDGDATSDEEEQHQYVARPASRLDMQYTPGGPKTGVHSRLESRQSYHTPFDSAEDVRVCNFSRPTTRTELSRPATRIRA